jgi:hypothetical protein
MVVRRIPGITRKTSELVGDEAAVFYPTPEDRLRVATFKWE